MDNSQLDLRLSIEHLYRKTGCPSHAVAPNVGLCRPNLIRTLTDRNYLNYHNVIGLMLPNVSSRIFSSDNRGN